MSWIQRLHETYDRCRHAPQGEDAPLLLVNYAQAQAHIEIVLDQRGEFQRAVLLNKETTMFPATESSAGRSGTNAVPHPLCDKLVYCAADYARFGGEKTSRFNDYVTQLSTWQSAFPSEKVQAVLRYVQKGTVVADLLQAGILRSDANGKLLTEWTSEEQVPALFKLLTATDGKRDQGDAFVRWRVQVPGDTVSAVWEDSQVKDSWDKFIASGQQQRGLCMVTGESLLLAENHPKRVRHAADGAKILSSNDSSGYTFRGRFENSGQACGVSSEVSQKAHNALRWLIARQGYVAGEAVFVTWAVSGAKIPDPLKDSDDLFGEADEHGTAIVQQSDTDDVGQYYALCLKRVMGGYRASLGEADMITFIGLDSATPGRLAITYYRELTGAELVDRVTAWHWQTAWPQNYSKERHFVGAPAPKEIAEAVYGKKANKKLIRATVERLLPCIIDGRPLPRDLVESSVRRAGNRQGLDSWEWEKCLGIACALVRGSHMGKDYKMSLEEDRTTRDYLFGRLLAIAEDIESRVLYAANEKRETNAAKMMQRFADHPCSTWRNLETSLAPYKTRLRANRPAILVSREKLLDTVMGLFRSEDFVTDGKLGGEFLLGYHCQRAALWSKSSPQQSDSAPEGEQA